MRRSARMTRSIVLPDAPACAFLGDRFPSTIEARELFEASPDGLVLVNPAGQVVAVNAALTRLLGYEPADVVGRGVEVMVPEALRGRHRLQRSAAKVSPHGRTMGSGLALQAQHADGSLIPVDISLGQLSVASGGHVLATVRDARDRRQREDVWVHRALHDPLTGLANRALLMDRLEQAQARFRRRDQRLCVLFLDLDGFKQVNDQMGHAAGDVVLVEVARRLVESSRPTDTVARLGGDEFVVLLVDDGDGTLDLARYEERVRDVLAEPIATPRGQIRIGCSIGRVTTDGVAVEADELLSEADRRMYEDKHARRRAHGRDVGVSGSKEEGASGA